MLRLSSLMHSVALLCALVAWSAPSGRAVTASGRYGFPYRLPESPTLDSFTLPRVPSFSTLGCLRVLYAFTLSTFDPPTFDWSFGSGITHERESGRESIACDRYDDFVDRLADRLASPAIGRSGSEPRERLACGMGSVLCRRRRYRQWLSARRSARWCQSHLSGTPMRLRGALVSCSERV